VTNLYKKRFRVRGRGINLRGWERITRDVNYALQRRGEREGQKNPVTRSRGQVVK